MPNIKNVLEIVAGKFGNDSLKKALEAEDLSTVEFTDDELSNITNTAKSLLTPEAALNNPELISKYKESVGPQIKDSIYGGLQNNLKEVGAKFGVQISDDDKVPDLLNKLKEVEVKKPKDVESYVKEIDTLNKQLSDIKENSKKEIEGLKKTYEEKELDSVITQNLGKYTLAEAYNKDIVKQGIFDNVKKALKDNFIPKISEGGKIALYQKDMPDKLVYTEQNKPLTFEDFTEPLIKDFVKKADTPSRSVNFDKSKGDDQKFAPGSMQEHLARQRERTFAMPK